MSISSAHQDYSITSIDSSDTITIDLSSMNMSSSVSINNSTVIGGGYISGTGFSSSTIGPITISDINEYQWTVESKEFENCFPSWDRVQSMCKEYPGLKLAYEKFVTTYKLVKDDYDTPKDQRPKP